MTINFNTTLNNLAGLPLKIENDEATLKMVCVNALLTPHTDENISGEEKQYRYELAMKVYQDQTDISLPDLALLKVLVGKTYGPIVVGPAYQILNGGMKSEVAA